MDLLIKLNRAEKDYMSNIYGPMTDAFEKALDNRKGAYDEQAKFEQIGVDLLTIVSLAALAALAPVAVAGAGAGAWLARGYASMRVSSGLKNSRSMLRVISNTRFKRGWSNNIGYQGISYAGDKVVSTLTYGGARVTGDLFGYGSFYMRAKIFAEQAEAAKCVDLETAQVALDPGYYRSNFRKFIRANFDRWETIFTAIGQDPELTDESAAVLGEIFSGIPLLYPVPFVDGKALEPKFELLFYLYDILDRDTVDVYGMEMRKQPDGPYAPEMVLQRRDPINVMPSSPNYPKSGVNYYDPGRKVGNHINRIYSDLVEKYPKFQESNTERSGDFFDNWLFVNDVNREVMEKAEECLADLTEAATYTGQM
ncbi:hypothetical protein AAD018_011345 [Aestuariibius insulae]|uniref:hypothetical protein n=1 Tax=Aestuariibius insulae TaxID=2058287 RepID=UPI00398E5C4B